MTLCSTPEIETFFEQKNVSLCSSRPFLAKSWLRHGVSTPSENLSFQELSFSEQYF